MEGKRPEVGIEKNKGEGDGWEDNDPKFEPQNVLNAASFATSSIKKSFFNFGITFENISCSFLLEKSAEIFLSSCQPQSVTEKHLQF